MRKLWDEYGPYAASALLAFLLVSLFVKYDPEVVTIEKPTVQIKETVKTDTLLREIVVENQIYIPVMKPVLNTDTRAVLDTVVRRDSASATLHVEYNKVDATFENVMAAFEVPIEVRELTIYKDREIRIEIPTEIEKPDTDDFQWFGLGGVFGVLATIIAVLL